MGNHAPSFSLQWESLILVASVLVFAWIQVARNRLPATKQRALAVALLGAMSLIAGVAGLIVFGIEWFFVGYVVCAFAYLLFSWTIWQRVPETLKPFRYVNGKWR